MIKPGGRIAQEACDIPGERWQSPELRAAEAKREKFRCLSCLYGTVS